jgi:hypothetical protein
MKGLSRYDSLRHRKQAGTLHPFASVRRGHGIALVSWRGSLRWVSVRWYSFLESLADSKGDDERASALRMRRIMQ